LGVKCGGAEAKLAKMPKDACLKSMRVKKRRMILLILKKEIMTSTNSEG
jgi:hypothetical protein